MIFNQEAKEKLTFSHYSCIVFMTTDDLQLMLDPIYCPAKWMLLISLKIHSGMERSHAYNLHRLDKPKEREQGLSFDQQCERESIGGKQSYVRTPAKQ